MAGSAPVACGLLIVVAYFVGLLLSPVFSGKAQRNTFIFLVAIPNWVFLPLPIAQALYGDTGVRTVLLCNAGAQVVLWSFGVWILHGSMRQAAKNLLTNIGLWATAVGIAMALLFPAARDLETVNPAALSPGMMLPGALVQALAMVGSLTIPMSLLAIGAQLGELTIAVHRFPKVLWGVLLSRLLIRAAGDGGHRFCLDENGLRDSGGNADDHLFDRDDAGGHQLQRHGRAVSRRRHPCRRGDFLQHVLQPADRARDFFPHPAVWIVENHFAFGSKRRTVISAMSIFSGWHKRKIAISAMSSGLIIGWPFKRSPR